MESEEDFRRLLEEKDQKISLLESHSSTYTARISVLQNRLLAAFDTLDSTQNVHAQELAALKEQIARLKEQLDHYVYLFKDVETERDDMRDVVMLLVEKVEASNGDYSSWPHSRLYVTNLEDPLEDLDMKRGALQSKDDMFSYAASIIEVLRKERDNERRSHAQTRVAFEARLVALEAQLSRREAELAACALHKHRHVSEDLSVEETTDLKQGIIDSDQIISLLDNTVTRNKVLEAEIKSLAKRLETARINQSSPGRAHAKTGQVSPTSDMFARDNMDMRRDLGSQGVPPDESGGSHREGLHANAATEPSHHIFRGLDHDIQLLGETVDAFSQERRSILQLLPIADSRVPGPSDEGGELALARRIRSLEKECDRLRISEQKLRDELDRTRTEARAREDKLLEEITTLKLDQDETERIPVATLLDDNDGEIPMELATPLLPVNVMSASPPAQEISVSRTPSPSASSVHADQNAGDMTPNSEGYLAPLSSPHSTSEPSDAASPASGAISSDDRSPVSFPPQLVAEILEREEAQLIDMQRQAEVGEKALNELLELVHELNS
ncbi:hypothetical protein CVT26_003952 [Gymnopilus dilepis]|uniref:Uncharacterized protein n=1 Tax=Gymnopilus dilepis TaxID=231916 RepID=A0A409W230_9AGAR|nr:hypothetical protein CVT26_003952 [Gymnopilus dilepis]